MIVSNYIDDIERKEKEKKDEKIKDLKYRRLKNYAIFLTFFAVFQLIVSIFI